MNLPKEIKLIRQRLFLTQNDFAKALDVSYTTVNRWETGKARPNLSAMRSLKIFCENNNLEYAHVEDAWLNSDEIIEHKAKE